MLENGQGLLTHTPSGTEVPPTIFNNVHRVPKKLVHLSHIDNLVNSQWIFKILSLTHSADNFL